jgi:Domain of unknown function (DUF4340)
MKKNTYLLIGIFALLILVAFLLMNRPGERDVSPDSSQFLFAVDSVAVDKIILLSPRSNVTFTKRGSEWYLSDPIDYRADQSSVTLLIHETKDLDSKEVVSSNPEKRSIFQVDSTGTAVKIFQNGQEHAAFVVGKMGQSYAETYVRKENSNDVHVVKGALSMSFNKAVKDWRDKSVLVIPKETIRQISYQYPGETFSVMLKDSVWMIGNDKAKANDVASLIGALSNVQADDFVDSAVAPAPKIAATITVGDVQLRFSEIKGQDKYYLQSSSSPQWFELQGWRIKQILKHKKDLI